MDTGGWTLQRIFDYEGWTLLEGRRYTNRWTPDAARWTLNAGYPQYKTATCTELLGVGLDTERWKLGWTGRRGPWTLDARLYMFLPSLSMGKYGGRFSSACDSSCSSSSCISSSCIVSAAAACKRYRATEQR